MKYYILLLLVGLFHTVSVSSDGDDGCKDQLREMRKEMNVKIDRLEKLLYQVLAATNYTEDKKSQFNVCTLESGIDQNCTKVGEIKCKSIDLLAKNSTCMECIAGSWQSVKSCTPYYGTMQNDSIILLENDLNINVTIYKNGTSSGEIMGNGTLNEEGCNCNCTWSKYSYNGTNLVPDKKKQLLLCNEGQEEGHYCMVEGNVLIRNESETVCFKKEGDCKLENGKVSCTTERYGPSKDGTPIQIIEETDCEKMKDEKCNITISIYDEDMLTNIIMDDSGEHHWRDGQVNFTCLSGKHDLLPFHKMCEEHEVNSTSSTTSGTTPAPPDDGSSLNSSTLFIIIIVILALILISYCGYQNQWHQKIYSYVNGTEAAGEARPAPSNRRGRMKGKYAPLPRTMEETVPCHAD